MVRAGTLEKVGPGRYRLATSDVTDGHSLVLACSIIPSGAVCLSTALLFHNFGTQLPREVWLAVPRGTRVPLTLRRIVLRGLARRHAPSLPDDHFRAEPVEALTFPDSFFSVVLSSAVLHFARDRPQFGAMLTSMWRVLVPGGMFFCRLASSIGIESRVQSVGEGRFRLPDRTVRYLVDEAVLTDWTSRLGGRLLDPLKTTIVHGQRAMTTWVVRKRRSGESDDARP